MNLDDYKTPLTDAAEKTKWWRSDGTPMETTTGSVSADFARKLERERDELREKIKSLTSPAIEGVLTRMKGNLEIVERIKTERDELRAEVERLKADRKTVCELATQGYLGRDFRDVLMEISDLTRGDEDMKGDA